MVDPVIKNFILTLNTFYLPKYQNTIFKLLLRHFKHSTEKDNMIFLQLETKAWNKGSTYYFIIKTKTVYYKKFAIILKRILESCFQPVFYFSSSLVTTARIIDVHIFWINDHMYWWGKRKFYQIFLQDV